MLDTEAVGVICVVRVRLPGALDGNGGMGNPFSLAFQAARTLSMHANSCSFVTPS